MAALLLPSCAVAAETAEALQARGILRIDRFIQNFRSTGDFRSQVAELRTAAVELESSYRLFAASSNYAQAAWSLVKAADCYRISQNAASDPSLVRASLDHYRTAAGLARKAGNHEALVKALIGMSLIEELSNRNFGASAAHAAEAVRAAASCPGRDCMLDALALKVQVETQRRELFSAASHVNGLLTLLKNNSDPYRNYSARVDRAGIYQAMADGCSYSFQKSLEVCSRLLELAKSDCARAREFAARGGFAYLADMAASQARQADFLGDFAKRVDAGSRRVSGALLFEARVPGDVTVSENFVAVWTDADARAMKALEQAIGPLPSTSPLAIFTAAQLQDMQGRRDAALQGYLRALRTLEQDRQKLNEESARSAFLNDKVNFYDPPILHLLQARRHAEAFDLLERSRARTTADLLATRSLQLSDQTPRALFAALALKRARIASLQTRFFNETLSAQVEDDPKTVEREQARLTGLEAEYETLLLKAAREAPRVQELALSQPVSLKALQDNLGKDPADLLYYHLLDHAVILIHVGPNSFHARNVFLPRADVISKTGLLRDSMRTEGAAFREDLARQLFLYLVQPALGWVSTNRLIVVPHGDLQSLPFQVLQDPATGAFLDQRFQVTYAPSASILMRLRRHANLAGASLLAAGDPSLRGARAEVEMLARLFPARPRIVTDSLIPKARLMELAGSYDILHLAVHGTFDAQEPLLSRLHLAAPADGDGDLTAAEVFGLPLQNTRLAALSACETGRVRITRSNDIQGMVQALLYAGAQSLLVSSWKVGSASTSLWMQAFYQAARTRPLAEAAQIANQAVRARPECRSPFHWAPFLLIAR